jgi:hypothetical protein
MKKILSISLGGLLVIALGSCGKKIKSLGDFSSYINEQDNGFKTSRAVNGVLISAQYLPPEYLALKGCRDSSLQKRSSYDSLLQYYNQSTAFIITFGPDETKNNHNDIMFDNIKDFREYTQRSMELNFDMEEKVRLKTGDKEYTPVLSSLENTYGLSKDRKVNLVFTTAMDKEFAGDRFYDLVYEDETFGVGTLHFHFDKEKMKANLPEISLN